MISKPAASPVTSNFPASSALHRRPPQWRLWLSGLGVAIALAGGGIYLLRDRAAPAPLATAQALPVSVVEVTAVSEYTTTRAYTGELVASRKSTLGFEAAGTIVDLTVDDGDRVTQGQLVATLDTRTLQAQRQQLEAERQTALAQLRELQAGPRVEDVTTAQARVNEIEQQLALAQIQRDRRADLYTQGAISREEFDRERFNAGALENSLAQAQSQLTELEAGTRVEQLDAQAARVQQLEARIRELDVQLDKSQLFAPFDGIVSDRQVDEGVVVSGGQAVLSVVEAGAMEARIGLPPDVANRLAIGSEQTMVVGDRTLPALVTALLPELDDTSRTVTVVLEMTAPNLTLGQTARLELNQTQPADGLWLPTTALVPSERGLWSVYVLTEPEATPTTESPADVYVARRRDVEVIHTEGDRALVRGTLQPGESAIATGTHRISPGAYVQPAP